jgi:hypothetical protein
MAKDFFEKVAADKTQLGFDYQDLVCLEYLIEMKPGEKVGLEVLDDIHHERIDDGKTLVQVKHSVNDGSALTNRDMDLWKTLYNWSKALDQLSSVDTKFIFFTNQKMTEADGFLHLINSENLDIPSIVDNISKIKIDLYQKEAAKDPGEKENPIKKYVDFIHGESDIKKQSLFSKIRFVFSTEDIFDRLAKKIEYFSISNTQSPDVLNQLIGVFNKKKYEIIRVGEKILIDYETFRNSFQFDRIIKISQDRKIDFSRYHQFKNVSTIDPRDGLFARQLSEIGISQEDITEHAIEYAATSMFIQKLMIEGEFSDIENYSINEEVFHGWKSLHSSLYDMDEIKNNEQHNGIARNCFRGVGNIPIAVANSSLSRAMVVGKSIELSDISRIGWRKDWKELYGGK